MKPKLLSEITTFGPRLLHANAGGSGNEASSDVAKCLHCCAENVNALTMPCVFRHLKKSSNGGVKVERLFNVRTCRRGIEELHGGLSHGAQPLRPRRLAAINSIS